MRQSELIRAAYEGKNTLVIKNANVVNVFTDEIVRADVAVYEDVIIGVGSYSGENEIDAGGAYLAPGFIDAHVHIESSMVIPSSFMKVIMPHGTTTVIADPHEIANVAGAAGIRAMYKLTDELPLRVLFMLPSCVPATKFDESGARLGAAELREFYAHPRVLGLGEVMDYMGVVHRDEALMEKIRYAKEADSVINVGVSGPGVVHHALQSCKDQPFDVVAETIKKTAFQITRVGQMVATEASRRLDTPFGIVDLSLAPTPAIGDSVARILEEMGLSVCGTHGTTAALALLNDAVKKGGVMASNHVGGLSGAFIPVSEDAGMIHAAEIGCLTIEKLEAMTAVCSVGIDMVIIPGDTTPAVISALIADEAAIGMVNSKTTAVRVIPAIGRKAGEILDFGGLLGYGPIMPVNQRDPSVFINRGGRLPAPMQSLKN